MHNTRRGMVGPVVLAVLVCSCACVQADAIANYNPLATNMLSDIPLPARWVRYGATATDLRVTNLGDGPWVNDWAYPVGATTTDPNIDVERYLSFTIDGDVTYESVQYDARSYGSGPYISAIRSSVDNFATNLDVVSDLDVNSNESALGFHAYSFDVSSLGTQNGHVEFRIYHWDSLDTFGVGGGFQDVVSSFTEGATGLTLYGTVDAPPTPPGIIANFNPTGPQESTFALPAAIEADGVQVTDMVVQGFARGPWSNPDSVYPVGATTTSPDIDLDAYIRFIVDGNVAYESVQYDGISYGSGPDKAAIRSSVDGFASNIDSVSGLPANSFDEPEGFHRYTFDITSLGIVDGPVEFRIYHWDSLDELGIGGGFQDLASTIRGATGLTVRGAVNPGDVVLQAGDADQDLDFDQLDLVLVQQAAKYLTGEPATWGEGDWNGAPGGGPGAPPPGNGLFDQLDIVAALSPGHYLTGPYAAERVVSALAGGGGPGDMELIEVPEPHASLLLCLGWVCAVLMSLGRGQVRPGRRTGRYRGPSAANKTHTLWPTNREGVEVTDAWEAFFP